jgi:hypothetical protein
MLPVGQDQEPSGEGGEYNNAQKRKVHADLKSRRLRIMSRDM